MASTIRRGVQATATEGSSPRRLPVPRTLSVWSVLLAHAGTGRWWPFQTTCYIQEVLTVGDGSLEAETLRETRYNAMKSVLG